jgi:hypothetical protein
MTSARFCRKLKLMKMANFRDYHRPASAVATTSMPTALGLARPRKDMGSTKTWEAKDMENKRHGKQKTWEIRVKDRSTIFSTKVRFRYAE